MHEFFLSHIFIKNFRAYKEFECEFTHGVNLVIGDNGAGKTSLLTAIAYFLSAQLGDIGNFLSIKPVDPHVEVEKAGDSTLSIKECFPIELSGIIKTQDNMINNSSVIYKDYANCSSEGNIDIIKGLASYQLPEI